jgi:hypothetical protein
MIIVYRFEIHVLHSLKYSTHTEKLELILNMNTESDGMWIEIHEYDLAMICGF